MLRHFFPREQSITFSNTRMIFFTQPVYFGIELIKLFLQCFSFRNVLLVFKDSIIGINLFPVRFITDDFLIKFPELDKQGSCQIFNRRFS